MAFLPREFTQFVSKDCKRFLFLQNYLNTLQIPFKTISIDNCKHIILQLPPTTYNRDYKTKTIIAHYDRALSETGEYVTPGANDNSAAVFQLIKLAQKIIHNPQNYKTPFFNIRIILTDGEELGSAQEQGSFALANLFKKLELQNDDIIVIDACGRGEILALSTIGRSEKASPLFLKKYDSLFDRISKIAKAASRGKFATIPVPYSDNAGFIANGIPAVALTILPQDELHEYQKNLKLDKNLLQYVVSNGSIIHEGASIRLDSKNTSELIEKMRKANIEPAQALLLNEKLPKTWRMMHTEFDNTANLTESAFFTMERFLDLLVLTTTK